MIERAYELVRERYEALGIDTDEAMDRLATVPISLHCWQGDDVSGFESDAGLTGGGIQATGNYPGKARTPDELRADLEKTYSLIPGKHRLALHAIYGEFGGKTPERTEIGPQHFQGWIDWAKANGLGLDFNQSFFSHPRANDGFTLSSQDESNRRYWVEHGIAGRRIGAEMGKQLGTPCVTNLWIPDGYKDTPVDRKKPRETLKRSLDEVFAEPLDPKHNLDAVECKLFGIGSESYVAGSHEFYMGYAMENRDKPVLLCLDAGHFHPTETIADKISSILLYIPEILLHVSRGVRWDSDHVVVLSDDVRAIAEDLVRGDFLDRTHVGLDFFDASINRVAAWVIGTRAILKALLIAMLEPTGRLRELEAARDFTGRLALMEELKTLPFGSVWDMYCQRECVPVGPAWLGVVRAYEREVLNNRR